MGQSLSPVVAAVSTMLLLHKTLLSVMRIVLEQVAMKRAEQTFRAASLSARCSTWDFRPKPRAIASVAFNPPNMMFDTACLASLASFAGKNVAPAVAAVFTDLCACHDTERAIRISPISIWTSIRSICCEHGTGIVQQQGMSPEVR